MKTAIACLCLLGLTMVVSAQDTAAPALSDTPQTVTMRIGSMTVGSAPHAHPGGVMEIRSFAIAKNVEIKTASAIVTADEAEIRYGAAGQPDELELRGNVRLTANIAVEYR